MFFISGEKALQPHTQPVPQLLQKSNNAPKSEMGFDFLSITHTFF